MSTTEARYDETCTPANQADSSSICRLVFNYQVDFADTRMVYIMVSSTAAVDTGDIRLTIAPVSSKTNCPPVGGVQGVVFQDASFQNLYITCLYPFGTGTRSEAVTKCVAAQVLSAPVFLQHSHGSQAKGWPLPGRL
jgi:hypothetical protein